MTLSIRRVVLIAALCACTIPNESRAESLHNLPIGTVVRDVAELGERQIPLPPGEWLLVAKQVRQSPNRTNVTAPSVPLADVYLVQITNGTMVHAIYATTNLESHFGGWVRDRSICDRNDTHFNKSDRNYNERDTECWNVNHFGLTLPNNPPQVAVDFYRFTDDKHRPKTALVNQFFIVKNSDFLQIMYVWNPEADGFPDTPTAAWAGNPWHRDLIQNDPARLAYVAKLKAEGERLFPLVKRGFDHQLPLPAPMPVAGRDAPSKLPDSPAPPSDVSARLQQLDQLRAKDLITPAEYDAQRQRILNQL